MTPSSRDDAFRLEPLLEASKNGDQARWNDLLGRVRPYLHLLVRNRLAALNWEHGLDDSGLVQEALLLIAKNFDRGPAAVRGESVPEFLGWVRKIVSNCVASATVRSQAAERNVKRTTDDSHALAGLTQDRPPELPAVAAELTVFVASALEQLSPDQSRTIRLRYYEYLSFGRIARELGRDEASVRVIHSRALEKLHDLLGEAL